jgi:hypothetical protein
MTRMPTPGGVCSQHATAGQSSTQTCSDLIYTELFLQSSVRMHTTSVVQANIKRTIGGVENIYKFPARASDALALLGEIDKDHTAILEVFHDLSVLLSTLSVAEEHIQQLRVQASIARVRFSSSIPSHTHACGIQQHIIAICYMMQLGITTS